LHVTFEEGTWAAWLYDLPKPYVTKIVVRNPTVLAGAIPSAARLTIASGERRKPLRFRRDTLASPRPSHPFQHP